MNEFTSRLDKLNKIKDKQNRLFRLMGNIKLIVFILGAGLTVYFVKNKEYSYGFTIFATFLFIYLIFVAKHSSLSQRLNRTKCMIGAVEKYLKRAGDEWTEFKDIGEEFVDNTHQYTGDLDIFGHKSLFQWINVGNTFHGRRRLGKLLSSEAADIELIKQRQNAVEEMSSKLDFCLELQCEGMLAKEVVNDPEALLQYAEGSKSVFKKKWIINFFYLFPFLTILLWALYLLKYPVHVYVPALFSAVQIVLTGIGYIKLLPVLNTVYKFKNEIEIYKNLIGLIEAEKFKDPFLSKLKLDFFENEKSASVRFKSLEKISAAIDLRYSPIIYFILNATLLWDFHCVFALEEWRKNNGHLVRKWIKDIGYFEAISSLAVINQINSEWNFPEFIDTEVGFNAKKLSHPLILADNRVSNDIKVKNNLCIITGSNMSGKTTLLRTIGINLVLAYAGAPVCAEKFECSIMSIFTSMRITDDLNSGISTFYAELLRIKKIVEYSKQKLPMIFLIDELFRGTNSKDRIIGARSLIRNLSRSWIIGLISTHDFELCDLENEDCAVIINYHFSESYSNNKIIFDYKLREGRSNTTNAKYLMKMVGIELME